MLRPTRSRTRTIRRAFSEVLLNVAALGGVVCIVLVALAFLFDISLIMFKTGSMSPTIPAGSVAMVREIPATEMRVGDVVTVDRAEKLPITHRVTSIAPPANGATDAESRTFTMRGDANDSDDVEPYTASTVRIVLGSVPGLANVIVWFSNPFVLGGITLAAAALVTWAFWPRDRDDDHEGSSDHGALAAPEDSEKAPELGTKHRATAGVGVRLGSGLGATVLLLAAASGLTLGPASPAHAAEVETQINGTVLRLTSIGDSQLMSQLRPGLPALWQVGVSADAPEPGVVTLAFSAMGELADTGSLELSITSCTERWQAGACTAVREVLVPSQPLDEALQGVAAGGTRILSTMPSAEQRWLLVSVELTDAVSPGLSETLRIHAIGVGDEVVSGGETGTLPSTGAGATAPLFLALAAIIVGLAAAAVPALWRKRRA